MNNVIRYILILIYTTLLLQNIEAQSDRQYIRLGNRLYRQENYAINDKLNLKIFML